MRKTIYHFKSEPCFSIHLCRVQRIVVFTGAGMSAESGIRTFRDSDGLWEEYKITDVATPEAFQRNTPLVLDFYNQRRKQVLKAEPNSAHKVLVDLEKKFDVQIITQNIDDLHERAGSSKVIHLHGEIRKARSTRFPELIYEIKGNELNPGEKCERGYQLRPHIVWFGEMVPMMEIAVEHAAACDIFIVIGTSLDVYPAASLINYAGENARKYLIDPKAKPLAHISNLNVFETTAGDGVPNLVKKLLED